MGKAQRKKLQRATPATDSQARPVGKTPYLLICAFLVVINLVIYWQVTGFKFSRLDDIQYVTGNVHLKAGLTADNIKWALTTNYAANWHPLTWISHMLDVQLFAMDAGMHHATSLALHIINTLLLFLAITWLTGHPRRSAFVAALFAVHPQHVESVAWVAERKDVLSTLFFLSTILAYTFYAKRPCARRYLLVLLAFVLGLMAKPMLVSLPVVLLVLDFWPLRRMHLGWKLIAEKAPLLVLAAVSCMLTLWAQEAGNALSDSALTFGMRAGNAAMSIVIYVVKTFWPARLGAYYPHPGTWPVWQVFGAITIIACMTVLTVRLARRLPFLLAGWLWYLVTLVPVLGLVQVGAQARADRYTYIPLIGIFIIVTWAACEWVSRDKAKKTAAAAVGVGAIAALLFAAQTQAGCWRDSEATYSQAIRVTDGNNWMAEIGLGGALQDKGYIDGAITCYQRAAAINPNDEQAYTRIGPLLLNQGEVDKAIEFYREAVRRNVGSPELYAGFATALAIQGNLDEAITYYRRAVEGDPNSAVIRYNLGHALDAQGKSDEAARQYEQSLRIDPGQALCHNALGIIYANRGKVKEAMEHFAAAMKADPSLKQPQENYQSAKAMLESSAH